MRSKKQKHVALPSIYNDFEDVTFSNQKVRFSVSIQGRRAQLCSWRKDISTDVHTQISSQLFETSLSNHSDYLSRSPQSFPQSFTMPLRRTKALVQPRRMHNESVAFIEYPMGDKLIQQDRLQRQPQCSVRLKCSYRSRNRQISKESQNWLPETELSRTGIWIPSEMTKLKRYTTPG